MPEDDNFFVFGYETFIANLYDGIAFVFTGQYNCRYYVPYNFGSVGFITPNGVAGGTIDNDISCTDYTIGYDTAMNTAMEMVDKLRDTSQSHDRCSVVEVMGRNCGDIAVWTAVAVGAECVICKETGYDLEHVIESINKASRTKNHAIIIVAEKILDVNQLAKEVTAINIISIITKEGIS